MGLRFRNATPGTVLMLGATALLAIVSFNTPLLKTLYFLHATFDSGEYSGDLYLGTLGYCLKNGGTETCKGPTLGYEFSECINPERSSHPPPRFHRAVVLTSLRPQHSFRYLRLQHSPNDHQVPDLHLYPTYHRPRRSSRILRLWSLVSHLHHGRMVFPNLPSIHRIVHLAPGSDL